MDSLYNELIEYLRTAGKELIAFQAEAKDIGVSKTDVTELDFKIERELTAIVLRAHPDHKIFAEEEHDTFEEARDIWIFDPISATRAYLAGRPHYACVISHIHDGTTQFAAVYDPSSDELFTAHLSKGAFLNGEPIHVSSATKTILENTTPALYDSDMAAKLRAATRSLNPLRNEVSFAVNYCWVASGRFDGVISIAKDSFPEFAGALILQEAGGCLTTIKNMPIKHDDRLFIGGNTAMHKELMKRATDALAQRLS